MPSLKQLTCHLKWTNSDIPLPEHHTAYADGYVQTYIPVPEVPTPFSIHLTSNGYIAHGLAMFVFIDGVRISGHHFVVPDIVDTMKGIPVQSKSNRFEDSR